ncbi:GumC family protein [Salipiger mangrovisoli]|uniref:Chain-length determining protein n=1 Tax=Salipiger mangrovisoli TaxID=2865933 RepID=A0ABR9WXM0_9RHOB|nr:Wzz/FepE/Etk N-terminal domain-containing protein [Salipiger mangrovisoli]MBE9636034.1 chain-length determining protein [Salipiger mangrovisoli]
MNQFQTFSEVLSALRRRFGLIFMIFVMGTGISVFFALNQPKLYEATAVVQIEEAQVAPNPTSPTSAAEDASRRVQLLEQRIMSRDNLVRIMREHQLFMSDPAMPMNQRVFQMREAASIQEIRANAAVYAPQVTPSGLMITVRLDDPQKAADVANELMHSVIELSRSRSETRARDALSFFEAEDARVETEIEAMDAKIASFKQQNSEALPAGLGAMRDQIVTLEDNKLELDRDIVALQANSARQREDVQMRQLALLQEQKQLIAQRIEDLEDTIRRAPEVERELSSLERERTQLQDQYSVITRRKADAEMGQMLEDRQQSDRFEVLETALVPEMSSSQSRRKLVAVGAAASLIAGLMTAFAAELMNPALRSAAQMERILGVQPVVSIPPVKARRSRRGRRLGVAALLLALAALAFGLMRLLGDRLPLIERLLPRVGA